MKESKISPNYEVDTKIRLFSQTKLVWSFAECFVN